jgi:hypothetical protein
MGADRNFGAILMRMISESISGAILPYSDACIAQIYTDRRDLPLAHKRCRKCQEVPPISEFSILHPPMNGVHTAAEVAKIG